MNPARWCAQGTRGGSPSPCAPQATCRRHAPACRGRGRATGAEEFGERCTAWAPARACSPCWTWGLGCAGAGPALSLGRRGLHRLRGPWTSRGAASPGAAAAAAAKRCSARRARSRKPTRPPSGGAGARGEHLRLPGGRVHRGAARGGAVHSLQPAQPPRLSERDGGLELAVVDSSLQETLVFRPDLGGPGRRDRSSPGSGGPPRGWTSAGRGRLRQGMGGQDPRLRFPGARPVPLRPGARPKPLRESSRRRWPPPSSPDPAVAGGARPGGTVAEVDAGRCAACLTCLRSVPMAYRACRTWRPAPGDPGAAR